MNYNDNINNHKAELLRRKGDGEELDLDTIFAPVDWAEKDLNKTFFAWLVKQKLASRSDINKARTKNDVETVLGRFPSTCCDYVAAYAELDTSKNRLISA